MKTNLKLFLIVSLSWTASVIFLSCQNDDDASFTNPSVNQKSDFGYETEPLELTPELDAELNEANEYMIENKTVVWGVFSRLCSWGNPAGIGTWYSIDKYTSSDGSSMLFLVKHDTWFNPTLEGFEDNIKSVELITSPFVGCP